MKVMLTILLLIVTFSINSHSEQNDTNIENEKVSEIKVEKELDLSNLSPENENSTYKTSTTFSSEFNKEKPKSFTEKIKAKIEKKLQFFEFKDE